MKCHACSAELGHGKTICDYCGSVNDIDLKGIHEFIVSKPETDRICPDCGEPLETIDLNIEENFFIEQCAKCYGLFFDPGELEVLLEKSVQNVFTINFEKLSSTVESCSFSDKVVYRKCPVCGELMNRKNYGVRSGVIVDICRGHGIWLDNGELYKILNWKKAGGSILDAKEEARKLADKEKERLKRLENLKRLHDENSVGNYNLRTHGNYSNANTIANIIGGIFRLIK